LGFDIGAAVHAIVNIALDFVIFVLPMFRLRSLKVSKKKRWQVSLMFAVGFFVTLVSVIRLTSLVGLDNSWNITRKSLLIGVVCADGAGDYIPVGYWSDLELNIGIACFCMPAMRVVIRKYFPHCGLASTAHDSDEIPLSRSVPTEMESQRKVRVRSKSQNFSYRDPSPIAKMPKARVVQKELPPDPPDRFKYNGGTFWKDSEEELNRR
jgi:hypothetical protein